MQCSSSIDACHSSHQHAGKLKSQVSRHSQHLKPSIQVTCQSHFAHQTVLTALRHKSHTVDSSLHSTMWHSQPHQTKHRNVHVVVSAIDNRNEGGVGNPNKTCAEQKMHGEHVTTSATSTVAGFACSEHRISLLPEAELMTEELRHGPQGQPGLDRRKDLCDSGLPDVDMCELTEGPDNTGNQSLDEAMSRGKWLLGLLVVQSTSSFVLDAYQDLLRDHLVVTLFLTMLVGAGGNAGYQSSIKVIRGLATGSISPSWQSAKNTLAQQASVGLLLGTGLSLGGFARVYLTNGNLINALAISISLFTIVMTSVLLGTTLPFAMAQMGVDPANSGTSIQVLMDILGVAITCSTCHLVLVQFAAGLPA